MEPSDIIYKIESNNDKPEKKPKKKQMKDIFERCVINVVIGTK